MQNRILFTALLWLCLCKFSKIYTHTCAIIHMHTQRKIQLALHFSESVSGSTCSLAIACWLLDWADCFLNVSWIWPLYVVCKCLMPLSSIFIKSTHAIVVLQAVMLSSRSIFYKIVVIYGECYIVSVFFFFFEAYSVIFYRTVFLNKVFSRGC